MKRKDLVFLKTLLTRINPQDEQVKKAIAFVDRDLAIYDGRIGQLKDQYDMDSPYR